jgi:hypothetical protein
MALTMIGSQKDVSLHCPTRLSAKPITLRVRQSPEIEIAYPCKSGRPYHKPRPVTLPSAEPAVLPLGPFVSASSGRRSALRTGIKHFCPFFLLCLAKWMIQRGIEPLIQSAFAVTLSHGINRRESRCPSSSYGLASRGIHFPVADSMGLSHLVV